MAVCNDCWCEHYDKSRENCAHCLKNITEEKTEIYVVLNKQAVSLMKLDKKEKGQSR
jgi:hypothetical protein